MKLDLTVALSALSASSSLVGAQFVSEPKGWTNKKGFLDIPVRYREVPHGICELTPGVKSYTGYVDIAERQHNFFWFFEARHVNPKDAPLTVWINGGPGSSSMIGLFQENGPCTVNPKGELLSNPYSWSNISNMLFIDQPTQTGFSYNVPIPAYVNKTAGTIVPLPNKKCPAEANQFGGCGTYSAPEVKDTANSTINAADPFWRTLQGFLGAFPQYKHRDFHFATESYGGHYGPIFNKYILDQNRRIEEHKLNHARHINLKSVLIGNGWYDPLVQYAAFYNFTVNPGNTYVDFFNQSTKDSLYKAMYGKGQCYDQTVACYRNGSNEACSNADSFCYQNVEYVYDAVLNRDEYDLREKLPDPFPYESFVKYLNTEKVLSAIGAYTNFSESSITVGNAFAATGDDDREEGTVAAAAAITKAGVYMVQYYGDADYTCNWIGGQEIAKAVDAWGYNQHAGFADIKSSDHITHGAVRQAGNFAFVRIYEAGHEVPFYQPLAAYEMFERTICGLELEHGRQPWWGYITKGDKVSKFREGGATVQNATVPDGTTYNTTTNAPNAYVPVPPTGPKLRLRRDLLMKGLFRPRN